MFEQCAKHVNPVDSLNMFYTVDRKKVAGYCHPCKPSFQQELVKHILIVTLMVASRQPVADLLFLINIIF